MVIIRRYIPVEKLRRLIDIIAYGTTALDAAIAIVTLFGLSQVGREKLLVPIEMLLTVIVLLAAISAFLIVSVKIYEMMLIRTFKIRHQIKLRVNSLNKYSYKKRRFFKLFK